MQTNAFETLAHQFHIPVPVVKQIAVAVAEKCALTANRYEPEGMFTMDQLTAVETVGAEIGHQIMKLFPSDPV